MKSAMPVCLLKKAPISHSLTLWSINWSRQHTASSPEPHHGPGLRRAIVSRSPSMSYAFPCQLLFSWSLCVLLWTFSSMLDGDRPAVTHSGPLCPVTTLIWEMVASCPQCRDSRFQRTCLQTAPLRARIGDS